MSDTNIPTGWALVPLEPTPEMIAAYWDCIEQCTRDGTLLSKAADRYKALLAAAPTPPVDAVPGEPVARDEYFWLVELFHRGDTGNSLGRYHTGFTDLSHRSRSTENVYDAKRYSTKVAAEKVAADMNRYGHLAALEWRAVEHGFVAAPVAPRAGEEVAWRDHVEQRLRSWRQRFVNKSGDQLALDDFMDGESLDDLLDYVLDEWATPPAPAKGEEAFNALRALTEALLTHADDYYLWRQINAAVKVMKSAGCEPPVPWPDRDFEPNLQCLATPAPAATAEPSDWYDRHQAACAADHGEYDESAPLAARLRWWVPKSARHGRLTLEDDLLEAVEVLATLPSTVKVVPTPGMLTDEAAGIAPDRKLVTRFNSWTGKEETYYVWANDSTVKAAPGAEGEQP